MLSKNQAGEIRSLHLKKYRETRKRFIAEGTKTVTEILDQRPEMIETIYAEPSFIYQIQAQLRKSRIKTVEISADELRHISLQSKPNQVLAVCFQPEENKDAEFDARSFSFYLDDIRDPGNFGTILRVCDWFGANRLYCSPSSCELYNPKVIQASMGAFLRVNVTYIELQELLHDHQISNVYGAVLNGKNIYDEKLAGGLVLIGNEANGISEESLQLVNRPLTISAHPGNGSESLNAAMATGIIASEFFRQLSSRR